jgi:hypothetical protein
MPDCWATLSGVQQSKSSSLNQRHAPFHTRPGSMCSAFRHMASVARPQYAGSACVMNCSASGKYVSMYGAVTASRKSALPWRLENGTHSGGRSRPWKDLSTVVGACAARCVAVAQEHAQPASREVPVTSMMMIQLNLESSPDLHHVYNSK